MSNKNKWSAFATPTKDELKALKKLIKVEPLLLSKSIVDDSEYRVYYNDENNNLQYLYVGNDATEKLKELIQNLKNSPDFKEMVQEMVKDYVKESIGDLIKDNLADFQDTDIIVSEETVDDGKLDTLGGDRIEIDKTSQHNYYFDCGNGSTGSFACLWKKDSEYFILTAAHNLLKNGSIDTTSIYKLVSPENKYNETIYLKYDADGWGNLDWARLKITDNKGNSMSAVEVEKTNFYKNCIKFSNIQDGVEYMGRETNVKEQKGNKLVAFTANKDIELDGQQAFSYSEVLEMNNIEKTNKFWKINQYGKGGNSGGAFCDLDNQTLVGVYMGIAELKEKSHKREQIIVGRIRNII